MLHATELIIKTEKVIVLSVLLFAIYSSAYSATSKYYPLGFVHDEAHPGNIYCNIKNCKIINFVYNFFFRNKM